VHGVGVPREREGKKRRKKKRKGDGGAANRAVPTAGFTREDGRWEVLSPITTGQEGEREEGRRKKEGQRTRCLRTRFAATTLARRNVAYQALPGREEEERKKRKKAVDADRLAFDCFRLSAWRLAFTFGLPGLSGEREEAGDPETP